MVGSVTSEIIDGICRIEFHHPKGNSMPSYLLEKLSKEIRQAGSDTSCRVIILSSEGDGAFCAGASFDELLAIRDKKTGIQFFMGFAHVILAMISIPKLIITNVQGKAVGGATGIIAASDYVIASAHAAVKLSELDLGIGPFVIGPVLDHKIGKANVMAMSVDREWRDAHWAEQTGLFQKVVETRDELDIKTKELATQLRDKSPEAMSAIKKVQSPDPVLLEKELRYRAELSGNLILSDHARDFLQSFRSN